MVLLTPRKSPDATTHRPLRPKPPESTTPANRSRWACVRRDLASAESIFECVQPYALLQPVGITVISSVTYRVTGHVFIHTCNSVRARAATDNRPSTATGRVGRAMIQCRLDFCFTCRLSPSMPFAVERQSDTRAVNHGPLPIIPLRTSYLRRDRPHRCTASPYNICLTT